MRLLPMLIYYVWWHYTTAIADLVHNYLNIVSFITNFFSLNHLTRNIFAPWRRLGEEYPAHFDFQAFASSLIVNTLMRIVGFLIRIMCILAGLFSLIVSFGIFILVFFAWLAMPGILLLLVVFSFRLFIA